jgi:signal peptidase
MRLLAAATGIARRTLDLVLLALILVVLATVLIARIIPAITGGQTFVVGGGSMEPAIPLGAAVIATPVDTAELAVGDIVSLQVGEQRAIFTHRITQVIDRDGETWLRTKGDANETPDPSIVPATAVIGKVTLTLPYAGYVIRLLGTLQGVAFLVALAILVLTTAWILEGFEEDQRAAIRRRAAAAQARILPDPPAAGHGVAG